MHCDNAADKLVEFARRRTEPDNVVRAHLASCEACRDRWESEVNLSAHLNLMRVEAARHRSPDHRKQLLMRQFEARHARRPAVGSNKWLWSFAAAAALLLGILIAGNATRNPNPGVAALDESIEAAEDGFIAVPFVPPLAEGELVHVVHTELQPAELASLGVNVDPSWTADLPVDLLIGADGFPRAVRVSDEYAGEPDS
jgi:predicted anti-sigma-YlaC factor YlaD